MLIEDIASSVRPQVAAGAILQPETILERIQCWWAARHGRLVRLATAACGAPVYLRLALPADAGRRVR